MKKLVFLIILCFAFTFLQAQISNDDVINYKYTDGLSDHSGTIKDCTKAIELNPNSKEAYINRGVAKYRKRHYEDAISDYDKALELDPKDAEAYCLRGLAKHYFGDKDGACSDWKKAVELGFNNASENIKEYCN
jgi:tetratricopeptide (TPR) repeat protein